MSIINLTDCELRSVVRVVNAKKFVLLKTTKMLVSSGVVLLHDNAGPHVRVRTQTACKINVSQVYFVEFISQSSAYSTIITENTRMSSFVPPVLNDHVVKPILVEADSCIDAWNVCTATANAETDYTDLEPASSVLADQWSSPVTLVQTQIRRVNIVRKG
ncbi:hypothetical protein J6590_072145 [Homalodisca vitripennis]|nr:hypothetical protein J6590_072145 [Homalodisca vitripennis]